MEEEFCFATPMSSVGGKELEKCCKMCLEWEKKSKKAEERCAVLELEIQKKNIDFDLLQGRFGDLAVEKLAIEENLGVLKKKNDELEERISRIENGSTVVNGGVKGMGMIVDLTGEKDEEDTVFNLMIENRVLDCEKKKAESEVDIWKVKFKELESRVFELEETLLSRGKEPNLSDKLRGGTELTEMGMKGMNEIGDLQASGTTNLTDTPLIDTPCKHPAYVEGEKRESVRGTEVKYRKRVRKQLAFGEEESPKKKIAPSTPGVAIPASVGVVNIASDSEDSQDSVPNLDTQGSKNEFPFENNLKSSIVDQNDEEDMGDYIGNFPFVPTPRRKRASNIITSDSESNDDDDNLPICYLKTKRLPESSTDPNLIDSSPSSTASRRRLVTLRKLEGQNGPERSSTDEDVEDDKIEEEDGSDSESESLSGFIVDTTSASGVSESDDAASIGDESEGENVDYRDVISRIRRKRVDSLKWEFEADMLAAFGKDPQLCMKAVCALYRQQTAEEKSNKLTIYSNQRGFSQCDAYRGSALAEFLTDGDPGGDLVKSVEELREYDPKGIEVCRTLATHYSKQLFAIYNNKEDPFFRPP